MEEITPYPFGIWPKLQTADVPRLRRVARWLPLSDLDAIVPTLVELLGEEPGLRAGALHVCSPGSLVSAMVEPIAAVVLTRAAPSERLLIEFSPHLAAVLADRVLGGDGSGVVGSSALSDAERGALAYGVARAMAIAGTSWQVSAVITTASAAAAAITDGGALVWSAEVRLVEHSGVVRLWVPDALAVPDLDHERPVPRLPLTLVLDAGEGTLAMQDVESLRVGDVVLMDEVFTPEVRVRTLGGHRTTWWCDGAMQVLRVDRTNEPAHTRGVAMTDVEDAEAERLAAVGDTPVTLSVEIARLTLPYEELAKLRPGEVLRTGHAVGDRVTLRAGDVVIATGELVDVEGEVGVRLERLG